MVDRATKETFELSIERRIEAPRERVFRAFTEEDDLSRWYAPEGLDVAEVSADVRVGGKWSVVMRVQDQGNEYRAEGVYREISPPQKLVFTHREGWSSCFDRLEGMFA